jgi:hypothetical protein
MRGVYTADVKISALAAAKTVIYITAPAAKVVEILSSVIENCSNETNEQLEATWQIVNALGTPTGTALTPAKHEAGDQAAGSTVVGDVTASEPSYVANTLNGRSGFSSLAGYMFAPLPEERPIIAPSATWGLRMLSTPTAFDAIVRVTFREIG